MNDFKKFRDEAALKKAYGALEREFTRKCQRIRELEQLLGTMERDSTPATTSSHPDGRETGRPQTGQEDGSRFFAGTDNPGCNAGFAKEDGHTARAEEETLLLGRILSDSGLTAKIVAEYVKSLDFPQVPTIMGGGGVFCTAPKKRPKTIGEASVLARKLFGA